MTTGTGDLIKRLREPPSGGNEHYGSEAYKRKVLTPAADALEAAERERDALLLQSRKVRNFSMPEDVFEAVPTRFIQSANELAAANHLARHATGQKGGDDE